MSTLAQEVFLSRALDPAVAEALTDASHAQRFAETYGLEVKYNHRRGQWLIYGDPIWHPDSDGAIYRLALEFVTAASSWRHAGARGDRRQLLLPANLIVVDQRGSRVAASAASSAP